MNIGVRDSQQNPVFCDRECQLKYLAENRIDPYTSICPVCKKPFTKKYRQPKPQIFCSKECWSSTITQCMTHAKVKKGKVDKEWMHHRR
jgi:hypothetical protein